MISFVPPVFGIIHFSDHRIPPLKIILTKQGNVIMRGLGSYDPLND